MSQPALLLSLPRPGTPPQQQHTEQNGGKVRKGPKPPGEPKKPPPIAPAAGCAQQWGRFVICSFKAAPSPGNSPALSIPASPTDRSLPWRREGDLAALLPGAEAGRAVPGFPPAPGAPGAVPWESWANHSRCQACACPPGSVQRRVSQNSECPEGCRCSQSALQLSWGKGAGAQRERGSAAFRE